jgi:hypothetical protein
LDEKADDEKVDERKARFFILPLQIVVVAVYRFFFFFFLTSSSNVIRELEMRQRRGGNRSKIFPQTAE